MATLLTAARKPLGLPSAHGGRYVLGVVEAMGWYFYDSMGKKPIPPTELLAFCKGMEIKLYPEEFKQALIISRAYLGEMSRHEKGAKGGRVKAPRKAKKEV